MRPEFYSYYHSADPNVYQPITTHQVGILLPDGTTTVQVNYWRAESFGVILPSITEVIDRLLSSGQGPQPQMPVIFGERVDTSQPSQPPPHHRATLRRSPDPVNGPVPAPPKMRYWRDPQSSGPNQWSTSPMVVTLRAPIDPAVSGENMHWLLLRDFWEIMHASAVTAVTHRTNGAGYLANVCFVGRQGGTFSTQMSAIPRRGDDQALEAAHYTSMDKWLIYSLAAGPVPARHWDDKMFDWRFGGFANPMKPAPLLYLEYDWTPPVTRGAFKPSTLRLPLGGTFPNQTWGSFPQQTSYPPDPVAGLPFAVENAGFASVCNDAIWGYSRKRDIVGYMNPLPNPLPFNELVVTRNPLLAMTLDAGTLHQLAVLDWEAPTSQQFVVDQFTQQAAPFYQNPGLPPLTPAQMREFVVSPRLYNERNYTGTEPGVTARPELPTPIRQLKELVSESTTHPGSPRTAARHELEFFTDLWDALYGNQTTYVTPAVIAGWQSYSVQGGATTVNLRDLWVKGAGDTNTPVPNHVDQVFWYSDPSNPAAPGSLQWIDLPHDFPLIDFFWKESELGRDLKVGGAAPDGLPNNDLNDLTNLVDGHLVTWEAGIPAADRYRNMPTSTGACLLQMMRMGYGGTGPDHGRRWVRLQRGAVEYSGPGLVQLRSDGELQNGVNGLRQRDMPWSTLAGLAFPWPQHASLFNGIGHLTPPYNALYQNYQYPANPRTVRASLQPEHINALVEFFLQLGGHYVYPDHNDGNPSRKLARFERLGNDGFLATLPGTYPLTSGLARMTVARALLDAWDFMRTHGPGTPPFSQVFRARAYDHNGQVLWPFQSPDAACVGAGLRAVTWNEDSSDPTWDFERGYQMKFLGLGGSYATMLTLFPNQGDPESYFWCTPGVQAMGSAPTIGSDPNRFDAHMGAFASNVLMRTHFSDFTVNPVSVTEHYYGP